MILVYDLIFKLVGVSEDGYVMGRFMCNVFFEIQVDSSGFEDVLVGDFIDVLEMGIILWNCENSVDVGFIGLIDWCLERFGYGFVFGFFLYGFLFDLYVYFFFSF